MDFLDEFLIDDWYVYGSAADGRVVSVDPKETTTNGVRDFGSEFPKALNGYFQSPPHVLDQPMAMRDSSVSLTNSFRSRQQRVPGFCRYEIKDHLGNVRTVISDIKNPYPLSPNGGDGSN